MPIVNFQLSTFSCSISYLFLHNELSQVVLAYPHQGYPVIPLIHFNELCDLLIEKKIEMSWAVQVRSDLAQDPELVNKMARAGLKRVYIDFKSINNETLKALYKTQTKSDIEKAIKTFHEFGVNIHIINVISLIFFHATIDSILLKLLYIL